MSDFEELAKSYGALEQIALSKMDDGEKVRWFQARSMSAEEANAKLRAQVEQNEIVAKYPGIKAEFLAGAKNKAEMELIAQSLKVALDEAKTVGQTTVEAAVKEALGAKDEEIAEMRKVYGKPRQPQAGDVTGSQQEQIAAAGKAGVGQPVDKFDPTKGDVDGAAKRIAEPFLKRLGFGGE